MTRFLDFDWLEVTSGSKGVGGVLTSVLVNSVCSLSKNGKEQMLSRSDGNENKKGIGHLLPSTSSVLGQVFSTCF